jgi:hypothetical protein
LVIEEKLMWFHDWGWRNPRPGPEDKWIRLVLLIGMVCGSLFGLYALGYQLDRSVFPDQPPCITLGTVVKVAGDCE